MHTRNQIAGQVKKIFTRPVTIQAHSEKLLDPFYWSASNHGARFQNALLDFKRSAKRLKLQSGSSSEPLESPFYWQQPPASAINLPSLSAMMPVPAPKSEPLENP
jgi:hypothetical protein